MNNLNHRHHQPNTNYTPQPTPPPTPPLPSTSSRLSWIPGCHAKHDRWMTCRMDLSAGWNCLSVSCAKNHVGIKAWVLIGRGGVGWGEGRGKGGRKIWSSCNQMLSAWGGLSAYFSFFLSFHFLFSFIYEFCLLVEKRKREEKRAKERREWANWKRDRYEARKRWSENEKGRRPHTPFSL